MQTNELVDLLYSSGIDHIAIKPVNDFESQTKSLINDIFPQTRSVIACALSYNDINNQNSDTTYGFIPAYTVRNYYRILSKKIDTSIKTFLKNIGLENKLSEYYRLSVNSKTDEKLLASACGLGFIGNNSVLQPYGNGSLFIIGIAFLSVDLDKYVEIPNSTNCGNCNLCIESCPTGALTKNGFNKEICIHHLSNCDHWPDIINKKTINELWCTRFFGCNRCVTVCPNNQNNSCRIFNDTDYSTGFIGYSFDPEKILSVNRNELKKLFIKNQLSLNWISDFSLIRNGLLAITNNGNTENIACYLQNHHLNQFNSLEKEIINKLLIKI